MQKFKNMETVEIECKIPIPNHRVAGDRSKYPWLTMKVGDSFFVPDRTIAAFSSIVVQAAKRFDTKYTCRTENEGVRVWRIK